MYLGGNLWRHLEFLKTLKSAKLAPDEILRGNVVKFRKNQNIYYKTSMSRQIKIHYIPPRLKHV